MTTRELLESLNTRFGLGRDWPKTLEVDAETYANICQGTFDSRARTYYGSITISVGPNFGIMFKGVELIYKEKN